jgi:hypothetical protein
MLNDDRLTAALRGIAEEDARTGASEAVAARLRAEFHAVSAAARLRQGYGARPWRYGAMAAAALVAAIAIPAWRLSRRSPEGAKAEGAKAEEIVTDFMPLTYSDVPFSAGQLVRLQVPRTALASFGLTPPDTAQTPSTGTVPADVIVGDDGLARAVRFVRSSP